MGILTRKSILTCFRRVFWWAWKMSAWQPWGFEVPYLNTKQVLHLQQQDKLLYELLPIGLSPDQKRSSPGTESVWERQQGYHLIPIVMVIFAMWTTAVHQEVGWDHQLFWHNWQMVTAWGHYQLRWKVPYPIIGVASHPFSWEVFGAVPGINDRL